MALEDRFTSEFWADFRARVSPRLTDSERIDAVAIGCARLAARRSNLAAREPTEEDIAFAASILTWWPGKPDPAPHVESELLDLRPQVFNEPSDQNLRWLDALVPNRTLQMDFDSLYAAQRQDIRAFLDVDKPRPPDDSRWAQAGHPFAEALDIPRLQALAAEAFELAIAEE